MRELLTYIVINQLYDEIARGIREAQRVGHIGF